MSNLIKANFFRIFKSKTIYIALLILLVLIMISTVSMTPGYIGLANTNDLEQIGMDSEVIQEKILKAKNLSDIRNIRKELGGFPLDKQILSANENLYYFFIIIVAITLTTDLSLSTAKNTLSSSVSRKKYYISKLITCFILCTGIILTYNFLTYLLNFIINGKEFTSNFIEIIKITLYQLPLLYGIMSLLISISFITKKTSIFNTITIPFLLVIQLLASLISGLFRINIQEIIKYEVHNSMQILSLNPETSFIIKCAFLGIAYIIIFNIIGYISFKKAEIK